MFLQLLLYKRKPSIKLSSQLFPLFIIVSFLFPSLKTNRIRWMSGWDGLIFHFSALLHTFTAVFIRRSRQRKRVQRKLKQGRWVRDGESRRRKSHGESFVGRWRRCKRGRHGGTERECRKRWELKWRRKHPSLNHRSFSLSQKSNLHCSRSGLCQVADTLCSKQTFLCTVSGLVKFSGHFLNKIIFSKINIESYSNSYRPTVRKAETTLCLVFVKIWNNRSGFSYIR